MKTINFLAVLLFVSAIIITSNSMAQNNNEPGKCDEQCLKSGSCSDQKNQAQGNTDNCCTGQECTDCTGQACDDCCANGKSKASSDLNDKNNLKPVTDLQSSATKSADCNGSTGCCK